METFTGSSFGTRLALTPALSPRERFPWTNSRVEPPEPRENIEHRTSNIERRSEGGFALPFDVRRSMFDVPLGSWEGRSVRTVRNNPPFSDPSQRGESESPLLGERARVRASVFLTIGLP